jgi:hypothetical protein
MQAIGALNKLRHGRIFTVIWYIADNRKARAAVCAVCEGVTVTPVAYIGDIRRALAADTYIGGYQGVFFTGQAVCDNKITLAVRRNNLCAYEVYARLRGRIALQRIDELAAGRILALDFGVYPFGGILNITADGERLCEPVDKRAEADPLHNALYNKRIADHFPDFSLT